ncbi:tripartite motif-containing protein 21 [Pelomyxa schiedti]|nr:tripartite motif-containing protein 21 [Pelomyxa schiedti]
MTQSSAGGVSGSGGGGGCTWDIDNSVSWPQRTCALCLRPPPPTNTGGPPQLTSPSTTTTPTPSGGTTAASATLVPLACCCRPTTADAASDGGGVGHWACVECAQRRVDFFRSRTALQHVMATVTQSVDPPSQQQNDHIRTNQQQQQNGPGETAAACCDTTGADGGAALWSPLLWMPQDLQAPEDDSVQLKCPVCGQVTVIPPNKSVSSLQTNLQSGVCNFTDEAQQGNQLCPVCDDPATHCCSSCGIVSCQKQSCLRIAIKMHGPMDHTFNAVEIQSSGGGYQRCIDHKKPLELFCTQDSTPVCSLCVLSGKHQDKESRTVHATVTIPQAAKERKQTILKSAESLTRKVESVKQGLVSISKTKSTMTENCSQAIKKVDEVFLELQSLLSQRYKYLASKCITTSESTERILTMQEDHLEKFLECATATLNLVALITHSSHDFGVIRSFDSVSRSINDLKDSQVYLQPCCVPEIDFTVDSNCDLTKIINSFGALTFGGVSINKSKFMVTPVSGSASKYQTGIVGDEWNCKVECMSLVNDMGAKISPHLLQPYLSHIAPKVLSHSDGRAEMQSLRALPQWHMPNDLAAATSCEISFIPQFTGRHSISINSTEIVSFDVKEIDPHKCIAEGDTTGVVDNPCNLNIKAYFSDGEPALIASSTICKLMKTRFKIVTKDEMPQEHLERSILNKFLQCENPTQIQFTLPAPGDFFVHIEALMMYKKVEEWIPLSNSPLTITRNCVFCVISQAVWHTIGSGIKLVGDTVTWTGSSCSGPANGGRIAMLMGSLQDIAGKSGRVYWAFEISKYTTSSCQDGVGACSSLNGLDLSNPSCVDYYPVTCQSTKGVKSFGLSIRWGYIGLCLSGQEKRLTEGTVKCGDQFSFLVKFDHDKRHATVDMFYNLKLLATETNVDTSVPLFPVIHMCCKDIDYRLVRKPTLPASLT